MSPIALAWLAEHPEEDVATLQRADSEPVDKHLKTVASFRAWLKREPHPVAELHALNAELASGSPRVTITTIIQERIDARAGS